MFVILETVKNSENVVKSGCFEKNLRWRAPISIQNERVIESLRDKNINILYFSRAFVFIRNIEN